jgi:hypothetical protein
MKEAKKMGEIQESSFSGKPILVIPVVSSKGTEYTISMGITKIKAVLDNAEACREFVAKHTEKAF